MEAKLLPVTTSLKHNLALLKEQVEQLYDHPLLLIAMDQNRQFYMSEAPHYIIDSDCLFLNTSSIYSLFHILGIF